VSSRTSTDRTTWAAIAIGVLLLGLVAAFAVGLPEVVDEPETELSLPDTLPGGYAAADDAGSFADGEYADQAEDIARQEKANSDYGNRVLPEVLGHAAATRTYVLDGTRAVFVQVFDAEGGAFAPNSLADPEGASGVPANEMVAVGDGVCILSYGQGSTGEEPAEPVFSQCQVTREGRTVQIGASEVDAEELVETADTLLEDL